MIGQLSRYGRAFIREAVAAVIRFSGLPRFLRSVVARHRVTIVVYHDPRPDVLARHLKYLTSRYQPITLDAYVDALERRDWSRIPPRALVVTIDDGHKGNRELADVFAKHGVRPTIYLCSQIVGTNRGYWFHKCPPELRSALKNLPRIEALKKLWTQIKYHPTREYAEASSLSANDLATMSAHFDFGAHTRFHPILTTCDPDEAENEIFGSHQDLEQRFGQPCSHFAFPNGDYTEREVDMVRRAGFRSARTTDVGWNGPESDPYLLRITGVSDDASINMLAVQVSGVVAYLRCVLAGNFSGVTPKHLLARFTRPPRSDQGSR